MPTATKKPIKPKAKPVSKPRTRAAASPKPAETTTFLTWCAPAHPFRKRTAFEMREAIIRIGVVILLAVFFKQFMLAAVVAMFAFVVFSVTGIEPEMVEHSITRNGISADGARYAWEDLSHFSFSTVYGQDIVHIATVGPHSANLKLLLGETLTPAEIGDILEEFIPYREEPLPHRTVQWANKVTARIAQFFAFD